MNLFITTLLFITTAGFGYSQLALPYSENFNSGMPSNWTQNTNKGISWTLGTGLGTSGSNCAIADQLGSNTNAGSAWLQSPALNLTSASNPVLTFKIGIIRDWNAFGTVPSISLWYAIGSGNWQFIENWGDPFSMSSTPTHTITPSDDTQPLNAANIQWLSVTKNLNGYSSQSNIRFSFGIDAVANSSGGWAVLDDVEFSSTIGINDYQNDNSIILYPNPSHGQFQIASLTGQTGPILQASNIKIYNVLGEVVFEKTVSPAARTLFEETISLNHPDGIYFLDIKTDQGTISEKLILKR